ncbi:hypothetical protein SDRG_11181 [Saprolegnia diclina VS20]|uniref:Gram-positive cocci surface proteins LPxTG domain-containing protein n=1 Tax=Saprolegnia diclina (strain VS20) TaxID=1156394 RepID=T0RFC9_SAPDV|nr:hypothetical protein SDRG_11181 [Saprolegnia diclina VS20]EQC30993.1 hypothetical protein SDRG_11181 [Saprolegnia diclina VS20]|eukprot:XP_008615432.1 hypothetical protein SDRG_11181 [Saprolegnia diclina VS20]
MQLLHVAAFITLLISQTMAANETTAPTETEAPAPVAWITPSPKERGRTADEQAAIDATKMSTGTTVAICGSISGVVALGGVALCLAEKRRRNTLGAPLVS